MTYSIQKDGSYKYKNVKLVNVIHQAFPTMVMVEKGPAKMKDLIGKRYVSIEKALTAIDVLQAENLIRSGGRQALEDLNELGLVGSEADVIIATQGE